MMGSILNGQMSMSEARMLQEYNQQWDNAAVATVQNHMQGLAGYILTGYQYHEPELKNVKAPAKTVRQELQVDVDLWLKGI